MGRKMIALEKSSTRHSTFQSGRSEFRLGAASVPAVKVGERRAASMLTSMLRSIVQIPLFAALLDLRSVTENRDPGSPPLLCRLRYHPYKAKEHPRALLLHTIKRTSHAQSGASHPKSVKKRQPRLQSRGHAQTFQRSNLLLTYYCASH